MSSIYPFNYNPEKMKILLNKLRLHMLNKEEARDFLSMLQAELKVAQRKRDKDNEELILGLIEVLQLYLADVINLYESNVSIVNRISNIR